MSNHSWIDIEGKNSVPCYVCGEEIPPKATNWSFTWGSDGVFPDGASAMYCCWDCRAFWIDPIAEPASAQHEGHGETETGI